MTVKAIMPVRTLNLVAPLPHEGTAMHATDTAAPAQVWSGAVTPLIGSGLRLGDVDSANKHSRLRTTPSIRTSTTATRTTTTRITSAGAGSSADSNSPTFDHLVQAYLDCRQHKRNSSSCQAFESHFARERLYADVPASFDELEGAILTAEHRLRHGGPFWGIGNRLRQCYDAIMAKPWNPNNPPMTLRESEGLLAAEDYRLKSHEEWKAIAMMAAAFLSICAFIALLGWWGVLIAGWAAKIALFLS
jgi:hypothetical protein